MDLDNFSINLFILSCSLTSLSRENSSSPLSVLEPPILSVSEPTFVSGDPLCKLEGMRGAWAGADTDFVSDDLPGTSTGVDGGGGPNRLCAVGLTSGDFAEVIVACSST